MAAIARIVEILSTLRPIAPWQWPEASRRLASGQGWMPPMLMIAALGSAWGMHGMWQLILGPGQAWLMQGATWVTWFVVGLIATCAIARRGAVQLWRFGIWGPTRPRWWFEASRLACIVTLLDAIVLVGTLSFQNLRGPIADVGQAAYVILGPAAIVWVVTATTGYALAWVRWLPLRGKAFDCVHYFYVTFGSLTILTIGVVHWPEQGPFWHQAAAGALAVVGLVVFIAGFISIIIRFERWERNRAVS